MAYTHGVVSVGTTATLIATPSSVPGNGGILVQNLGSGTPYLGGPTVHRRHRGDWWSTGSRRRHCHRANNRRSVRSPVRHCRFEHCQRRDAVSRVSSP